MSHDVLHGAIRPLLVAAVTDPRANAFSLPSGTISFVLADIEGSSRDLQGASEPIAGAILRCEVLLDEAIVAHGGVRPVEPGAAHSMVGAFSRASDALAAALDAQRALVAEPWPDRAVVRVRMAVHTGEAQLRDDGDYFGHSVMQCARLREIGHGGQVLVSAATATLTAERLPEGAGLIDLGSHRLTDLRRPERVWQLAHPDLAVSFPPLRSLDAYRHNLPVQLTPMVGREADVGAVGRLLAEERLVTLTGSGGVGKTRLALAVAAEAVARVEGGVWLVALAGVADADGVAAAALAALGAHHSSGMSLVELLAMALGNQPSVLVLDNCEHVIEGCAELVAALLIANPAVSVLATSRESLDVPGEVSWRVPSLDIPPPENAVVVSTVSHYDAVRLFIDRARRARPSFVVSEQNAPAVAQICQRLDGIPLALELAAARCRQLSPERIAQDLDDRFRLLTGGGRTVLPRHRTLAASIDWSHDRLEPDESTTFRRLGVFAGLFPLEAAEAVVAAPDDLESTQVFDLLSRLVDKSLVGVEDGPHGEPGYRLLETLRAYALERLRVADELTPLRDAHARWCLDWLDEREAVLHLDAVVDQVESLHDNLRAALDWCLDQPVMGLRLLGHLARAWHVCGRPTDAMAAVDRLLTETNARSCGPEWIAAALPASVLVDVARGFNESVLLLQRTEQLAAELDSPYEGAVARWLASFDGESCQAARDAAREHGDAFFYALTLLSWMEMQIEADPGAASQLGGDDLVVACDGSTLLREHAGYVRAQAERAPGNIRHCLDAAFELTRSRSAMTVAGAVNMLSAAALLARDETALSVAVDTAERKLAKTSDTWDIAQHRLGLLRGEPPRVERYLREHVDNVSPSGLHLFAKEAIDAGDAAVAIAAVRTQVERGPYSQAVLAACEAASADDEDRWHDTLEIAATHGLRPLIVDALEGLAAAASRSENWVECLRLYGAASRIRNECEYRWRFPAEQHAIDEAVATARRHVDRSDADNAEAQGHALPWPEAILYARRARGERKRPRHGWAALTPTEEQVVSLVAEGLTNPQIATRLLMGRATVKTHLEHIFAKLAVTSRSELASRAVRREG